MEQPTKIVSVAALPQVRVLGRTTGTDVVNLFWTGSGIEFIYTGSEIQVAVNADYDAYEPWLAVELNGVQIGRVPLNKGKNEEIYKNNEILICISKRIVSFLIYDEYNIKMIKAVETLNK